MNGSEDEETCHLEQNQKVSLPKSHLEIEQNMHRHNDNFTTENYKGTLTEGLTIFHQNCF